MGTNKVNHYTQLIKTEAMRLGFLSCGISKADYLEEEAPRLEKWRSNGFHGEMSYMENHFDKRLDPRKLVSNAKSVISLQYNYYTDKKQKTPNYKISKYAFGEDYHHVVKSKLFELMNFRSKRKSLCRFCPSSRKDLGPKKWPGLDR